MNKLTIVVSISACVLWACSQAVDATGSGPGEATASILDKTWTIKGNCEKNGDRLLFVAPGDPMLTIGINAATGSEAVGNFSSVSERFALQIGTPRVAAPKVDHSGNSFSVSGTFAVFDEATVDGTIAVKCNFRN